MPAHDSKGGTIGETREVLRRELTEQVPRFFDELGFRIVQDEYDGSSFGNSVLTLESHEFRLRFVRDRGQLFGEVASPSEPDNWWNLEDVWDILGMQRVERGSELKAFGEAFKSSYSSIARGLGSEYPRVRSALSVRTHERKAALVALLSEKPKL